MAAVAREALGTERLGVAALVRAGAAVIAIVVLRVVVAPIHSTRLAVLEAHAASAAPVTPSF